MNRSDRRKQKRLNGKSKTDPELRQALDLTHSIGTMVAAGAMKTDFENYQLHIMIEVFWLKLNEAKKINFAKSMLTYFNMNNGRLEENEHDTLEIFNIETGQRLATYTKQFGLQFST